MVEAKEKAASVEITGTMQAGFEDAMDRVKELGLKADNTLVDSIGREDWVSWDASHEKALVIDPDGIDGADCDDDLELDAA